jgi:hypothetical protein
MKRSTKLIITVAFVAAITVSLLAGHCIAEQQYRNARAQRCETLLSFAINKAETEDLSDPNVMEALISNVYAAYQFCDDPGLSAQLHDLWNALIFRSDSLMGSDDLLATQLRNIAHAMETKK